MGTGHGVMARFIVDVCHSPSENDQWVSRDVEQVAVSKTSRR